MKIKKISAPTMAEALQIVKKELGADAVVLNSKTVESGGVFGLFKRKSIEVVAAIDEKDIKTVKKSSVKSDTIHQTLNELSENWKGSHGTRKAQVRSSSVSKQAPVQQLISKDEVVERLYNQDLSKRMIEQVLKNYTHVRIDNEQDIYDLLVFNLKNIFRDIQFGGITFSKKFVNVVGPTGVGKTTTLAKLAAKCVLTEGKKVAFITTDTYRISAIEQLRTYAQILGVPLEVCYTSEDFLEAKNKFSDYDVVFIDSAGRNFLNHENVLNLTEVIDYKDNIETFLVFSLTAKYSDMKEIFKQFSVIPIHKFIFTKLDETKSYGAMFNLMHDCHIGTAYITNGQNVPDDFVDVDLSYIINLFVEGYKYERSS